MEDVGVEQVDKVQEWRQEQLERAGYEPTIALRLAADRACSQELAVKILA